MAVTAQIPRNISIAAAGATSFAYNFKILAKGDLLVKVDGVTKTVDIDFTVTGVGQDSGGNVIFNAPLVGGEMVLRKREMTFERLTDFQHLGDLRSPTLNADQDAPLMMIQQLSERQDRSIQAGVTAPDDFDPTLPDPVASRALIWSSDLKRLVNSDPFVIGDVFLRSELGNVSASPGAGLVGFKQGFAGALGRTVMDKLREVKSLKDFGAMGDGVTDDTVALRAALTYAQGTPTVLKAVPEASYRLTDALGVFNLSDSTLDLRGATLSFRTVTNPASIELLTIANASGLIGASAALTANAVAGDRIINCATASFAVGQIVRIRSEAIYDSTRTNTRIGEIATVEEIISGSQLKITTELQDGYLTADTATIEVLNPVRRFRLLGGRIVGPDINDETTGIRIVGGNDCHISDLSSLNVDQRHLRLENCTQCSVTNSFFRQSKNDSQGYGVSFVDCAQDCIVSGCFFTDVRHSLSTNNGTGSYGLVRRILFIGNNVTDSAPALGGSGGDAIDTHAAAEDIFILDNVVNSASGNGINVEARSAVVRGNWIKGCQANGININPYPDRVSTFTVEDNTVINPGLDGTSYGISMVARAANGENWSCCRNKYKGSAARPIRVININGYVVNRINISGNIIDHIGSYGIEIDFCNWVIANGNNIKVTPAGATDTRAFYLKNSAVCVLNGNAVELAGSSTNYYGVIFAGTSSDHAIVGNSFWRSGAFTGTVLAVSSNASVTNYTLVGNASNMTYVATGAGVVNANNS